MTTNQPDMFEVTDPSINVFKHVIRPLIEHSLKNEDSTHNGQYKSGRSSQQCIVNKIHSRHVCLLSQSHGENKESQNFIVTIEYYNHGYKQTTH